MNNYFDKLFADLSDALFEEKDTSIKRAWNNLAQVNEALTKLKERIHQYPFKSIAEEINFFKREKPRFLAEQLYAVEMINLQSSRPGYEQEDIKNFLRQELHNSSRFFTHYKSLYQYYQLEADYLDELLFIRATKPPVMLLPETPNLDPGFATHGDYAFAKFMAVERLQTYLIDELKELDRPGKRLYDGFGWCHADEEKSQNALKNLRWTGESINLVEIAYGMWLTGQVNNGNASVTEIVEFLEQCFSIQIGAAHRRWQSISRRKRIAPFKYVDEVKAALVKRLEEEWGK